MMGTAEMEGGETWPPAAGGGGLLFVGPSMKGGGGSVIREERAPSLFQASHSEGVYPGSNTLVVSVQIEGLLSSSLPPPLTLGLLWTCLC